jgi:anthranilate synthase component II
MILIIDNYDSFTYNLYQGIAKVQPDVKVIRNDRITVNEIIKLNPAGIILSPGPGRPEEAGICIELVQALDQKKLKNVPLLGVCLGLQAMTIALGGKVIQANGIVHGKSDWVFHHRQGLYQRLPLPFQAGRYHSLIAERASLTDKMLIEAESADGLVMGICHAELPMYGVQFHPESILTPEGNLLLEDFVKRCVQQKVEQLC